MMISVVTPNFGEVISLHTPIQNAFLRHPESRASGKIDWLNLEREGEDLSKGKPVRVQLASGTEGRIRYSKSENLDNPRFAETENGEAILYNLEIGETYYYRAENETGTSELRYFRTEDVPPRLLYVEGIANVRDIGGFRGKDGRKVRQGWVIRTSELNRHTEITEKGKSQLYALGVKTELDIRGQGEEPGSCLDESRVKFVNIPLSAYGDIFTEEQKARYRDTFRLLLHKENYPLFIHCWGGCDRTGTWLFILSALLGVGECDLYLDYEFSSLAPWGGRSRRGDLFRGFLDKFYGYGKTPEEAAWAFLRECGMEDGELAEIQETLLEPR